MAILIRNLRIGRRFIASENFQKMPCYPCDGSIKIIDGVVVVKWSNFEVR